VARSRNHCCRGRALSITHYERMFVCVFHADRDRQTDEKKLMAAFRNFANAPNKTVNSRAGKR